MAELEAELENKLIERLCHGESQWIYEPELNNEEKLWANFRKILEMNNKAVLDGGHLSESEFAQVKNAVSHASFYEAGCWLMGEGGRVSVHVQRGNEKLHLLVFNKEHNCGGTSIYQVINQYNAFAQAGESERDRRFDVTLLINGLPLIHIELKSRSHSYKEGFRQIKKYIEEGKFHGLFSNVQLFVVSNAADTKYFAPAYADELKAEFLTGWVDENNRPVGNYLSFAGAVLKIPQAHELVAKYTVLDHDAKRLIVLRPYQIHAIEAVRAASHKEKSGFVWHTTGSGKTVTSYKATRNLLMDIPSLDKTLFLIDRRDLDQQTTAAFQSYAENDTIDVDDTDHTADLLKKLSDGSRAMIVTTIQKLQNLISRSEQPNLKDKEQGRYAKVRQLKLAIVVDECHRAVTPQTKREIERFFGRSLWYGFTGTPIFEQNAYEARGDLPRTTEELYGPCLHRYTIKEAVHDRAVLGFTVENMGQDGLSPEEDEKLIGNEKHMREVLRVILNQSKHKLKLTAGRGQTFEGLLTVSSIAIAQKYYDLLKRVKAGEDELKIDPEILKALPDFPKFAITYSVVENAEASAVNTGKMEESLSDYNAMFGTGYQMKFIRAYNSNLTERLARKNPLFHDRGQQLDLVIVVDRLLTGFDAPCLSTLFIDRPPMSPQGLIQAFSRTNRLFNKDKDSGQVVTFLSPKLYKKEIDDALTLYSCGGLGTAEVQDWDLVLQGFIDALRALREFVPTPRDVLGLSLNETKRFVRLFWDLDRTYSQLRCFAKFTPQVLEAQNFSEQEYEEWLAVYQNLKPEPPIDPIIDPDPDSLGSLLDNYELKVVTSFKVDYEYIVQLLRGLVQLLGDNTDSGIDKQSFDKKVEEIRSVIADYTKDRPALGKQFGELLDKIVANPGDYSGRDVAEIINEMTSNVIITKIQEFAGRWFVDEDTLSYEAYHYRAGELENENKLKEAADYDAYCQSVQAKGEKPLPKFKFRKELILGFQNELMAELTPLFH